MSPHSRTYCSVLLCGLLLAVTTAATAQDLSVSLEARFATEGVDEYIADLFEGYDVPIAQYEVEVHLMMITALHPSGVETPVRVQVVLPVLGQDQPRGVYLFAPGSTGLINPCRASREPEVTFRWGDYRAHVMAFAGQGFIGVLPDYLGFEDWNLLQPYFHAPSEAQVVFGALDGVHRWLSGDAELEPSEAMGQILQGIGISDLRRVVAGYSQGGHAIFAAADANDEQPDEIKLSGIVGYGPTTGVEELFIEYSQVAPMVVQAYASIYGDDRFDPFLILDTQWAETLAYDTSRQCVGGIQAYYPGELEELYQPEFLASLEQGSLADTHPDIAGIMAENRTGMTAHGVPALVVQGTNDIVVDRWTQDDVVVAMRDAGNPVKYYVYQGSRHDTRQIAFDDVIAWIDQLGAQE